MNGIPNYKNYSLQELREALRTIDKDQYSERAHRIAAEIEARESGMSDREQLGAKEEKAREENDKASKAFKRYATFLQMYAIIPETVSLLLGAILCMALMNIWRMEHFSLTFTFSYPWMNPEAQFNILTLRLMLWLASAGLFLGAIGAMFKIPASQYLLAFCWCALSLGIQLNSLRWWPTLSFDVPFEFSFSFSLIATLNIGFKINFMSAFFFIWTALLIPEVREDFLENLCEGENPGSYNFL